MKSKLAIFLVLAWMTWGAVRTEAQWLTQPFDLKAGWNAIYLHVDAQHDTIDNLVGADISNPIEEIWQWSPAADAVQFIKDPQTPAQVNYWASWTRVSAPSATLLRLPGNAAFLVRAARDYTWNLKGKPVTPRYQWTGSGLNFLGFPTVPGGAAPSFDTFLGPAPDLKIGAEIFRYIGGPITDNPKQVLDLTAAKVRRGEAFWIRSTSFNRYFGPFDVIFGSGAGLDFGETLGQQSFRLRNFTKANLNVRLELIGSEASPAGQTPGLPPLLLRGAINPTNLTYAFSTLASAATITLRPSGQPGADVEVVVGLNRSALTQPAGSLLGGVLRLTDSLNYSQVDVPVAATVGATAGLWVGNAVVSKVNQYLTTYHTADSDLAMNTLLTNLTLLPAPAGVTYVRDAASKRILKFSGGNGTYLVKNVNTDSGKVIRPYPLRLIVHNNAGAQATLLQRVFVGVDTGGDLIAATKETLLDPKQLASARRISAAHLPFNGVNRGWDFSGALGWSANISATVAEDFADQASNPFLHTYHPDHDNLDALFGAPLGIGDESYGISRVFRLVVNPPQDDFGSLTAAGTQFGGQYTETITLTGRNQFTRSFDVSGDFLLNRITTTQTLKTN